MGKPAARIGDMHVCPMVTPGLPPIPHVGGPITGPGCPTVLIGETGSGGSAAGDAVVAGGLSGMPKKALENVKKDAPPQLDATLTQALALKNAAEAGTALVHNPQTCPICAKKMKG
jgi:hypothetical protein